MGLGPTIPPVRASDAPHAPTRRRPLKAVVHVLRRGHLYAGLLMLPWVLLYGVTAFLFNHPTAFADAPTASFDRTALAGTPMHAPPAPAEVAGRVVAALQARAKPGTTYALVEPEKAKYTREAAFAVVKADGQEINVLIDATGSGGTVRARPAPPPKTETTLAPFALAGTGGGRPTPKGGERGGPKGGDGEGLKLDGPLHERVLAAVPVVLQKTGFPGGEITVTFVPDLSFLMDADGTRWRVTYNAQAGSVAGRPAADEAADPLSARRFLTRLHLAHGFPGDFNAKWAWALVVDATAAVMVFWALSGVLMWWQIRATRWLGLVVIVASAVAAIWVGVGMHELFAAGGR